MAGVQGVKQQGDGSRWEYRRVSYRVYTRDQGGLVGLVVARVVGSRGRGGGAGARIFLLVLLPYPLDASDTLHSAQEKSLIRVQNAQTSPSRQQEGWIQIGTQTSKGRLPRAQ